MKKFKRVQVTFGGKVLNLYEAEYKGKKHTGNFRECLLFSLGYGSDQAAELRYMMRKKIDNEVQEEKKCCTKML